MGISSSVPCPKVEQIPLQDGNSTDLREVVDLFSEDNVTRHHRPFATSARIHAIPRLIDLPHRVESDSTTFALLADQLPGLANLPMSDIRDTGLCRAAGPGTEVTGALSGHSYPEGLRVALRSGVAIAVKMSTRTPTASLPVAPM
jgi:hypothetical protein